MKTLVFAVLAIVLSLSAWANDGRPTAIRTAGLTTVQGTGDKFDVRVVVLTREIDIGKATDEVPNEIHSNCTYSRFPCSVVDHMKVVVNKQALFVPRSVYADLADLTAGRLVIERNEVTLFLYGGDASEAYEVRIRFNGERVMRRTLSSALEPAQPLQETVYHAQETS